MQVLNNVSRLLSVPKQGEIAPNCRDALREAGDANRLVWFDYAKGICIILVVMMHSTLGVGLALGSEGWLHTVVSYAQPFRMPDFFLLSGLFLCFAIQRDWRLYFDRKVLHFLYFYLLWSAFQVALKVGAAGELTAWTFLTRMAETFVTPNPTLWFIYVLPMFFVATKLLYRLPTPALWLLGAALHTLAPKTGWYSVDEFAHYYVFFLSGYVLAPYVFKIARWAEANVIASLAVVAVWAVFNGFVAFWPDPVGLGVKLFELPVLSIATGLAGAFAIVMLAAVLAKIDLIPAIRFCGQHSIVLYLAFTIPMAITRIVLVKLGVISDVGAVSFVVTSVALISPLVLFVLTRKTPLRYLFVRPDIFKLERPAMSPHRKAVQLGSAPVARIVQS
ncbi:MAG: acyltransferase family protein [Hyphomicrobiaceae bacterium]